MSTVLIPSWRTCLDSIKDFPTISSTDASTHIKELANRMKEIANVHFQRDPGVGIVNERPVSILGGGEYDFSTLTVFKSAGRAAITYLALTSLAKLSLYVNGVVGVGKVALALLIGAVTKAGTEKYRDAQNLLEQGVFHIASGVADFAIGYFTVLAASVAILNGVAPLQAQGMTTGIFAWKGAIGGADNLGQAVIAKHRENYSWLQDLADRAQRLALPDEGAGRWQAFFQPKPQAV
jgi:hypothetical protein